MFKNKSLIRDGFLVNGTWVRDRDKQSVINPSNNKIISQISKANASDIESAIRGSVLAFDKWRRYTAKERCNIMHRYFTDIELNRDDLAKLITLEAGKTLFESNNEISYGLGFLDFYAEEAKRIYGTTIPTNYQNQRAIVLKEPVGVCAAITPWNFPFAMVMRKIAPALAAGCSVIIRPSNQTPLTTLALGYLAQEAGIPDGVINILTGDNELISDALCSSDVIRKLTFTGSTDIGIKLYNSCGDTMKKLSLELGGNSPFIVFDDADLVSSINGLIDGKFRNSGQACVAPNRIFVSEALYDSFVERLLEKVKQIKVGDGCNIDSDIGPLINQKSKNKIKNLIDDAVSKGAKLLCGGDVDPILGGNFFMPTLLVDCHDDMCIFDEEIFGPVVAVYKFKTEEEVLRRANTTRYGLASYCYTQNINRTFRVAEELHFGIVGMNTGLVNAENVPLGGVKHSGLGREGSHYGLDDYISKKYVCLGLS